MKSPIVFVGCSSESLQIAKAIQINLANVAHVELWTQGTFKPSHDYLGDLLHRAHSVDFAVFVLSPDDVTKSRNTEETSPRDNIIFEAGLFMGALGRDRVFLLAPKGLTLKKPTDLSGITLLMYSEPPVSSNWRAALGAATSQIEEAISDSGRKTFSPTLHGTVNVDLFCRQAYASIKDATNDIRIACKEAAELKILAIAGVSYIGRDDSVISTAELESYSNLRKLRILLMSTDSRWLTSGLAERRGRESVGEFVEELRTIQQLVEIGIRKMIRRLPNIKSGIRYFLGEPCWRMIMTDQTAFVSNYADDKQRTESRDLAVFRFDNVPGSFYSAFRRRFNDIWHNDSKIGNQPTTPTDLTMSAGGIVYFELGEEYRILLLRRHDGNWVLPKGHKVIDDQILDKTALREVSEESGIPVNQLSVEQLVGSYADNSFPNEQKEVFIYSIRCKGDTLPDLKPDADHAEARWHTVSNAVQLIANPVQKSLLARFAQSRRQQYNEEMI